MVEMLNIKSRSGKTAPVQLHDSVPPMTQRVSKTD